jgi:hypothetical protein
MTLRAEASSWTRFFSVKQTSCCVGCSRERRLARLCPPSLSSSSCLLHRSTLFTVTQHIHRSSFQAMPRARLHCSGGKVSHPPPMVSSSKYESSAALFNPTPKPLTFSTRNASSLSSVEKAQICPPSPSTAPKPLTNRFRQHKIRRFCVLEYQLTSGISTGFAFLAQWVEPQILTGYGPRNAGFITW